MGKKFKGIGCPCVTPFHEDGSFAPIHFRELIDFLINNEIDAIIPGTVYGEEYSLSEEEFHQVIDVAIDQVNNEVPVYIALPTDSVNYMLRIISYVKDAGVDGIVAYPPHIPFLSEHELIGHFEFISQQFGDNVIIVNDPIRSNIDLSITILEELSKTSNIVGIIELSGDPAKVGQLSSKTRDQFRIYTGRDLLVPQAISEERVDGAVIATANVIPHLLVELFEAYSVRIEERFEEIRKKIIPLSMGLQIGSSPAAMKAALNLLGIKAGYPRRPLGPLLEVEQEKLKNTLIQAGVLRPTILPTIEEEKDKKDNKA
jgi:4-hydroxy-tetrahydrodipicolinate synthase